MARNEWWKQFPIGTRVRFVRAYGDSADDSPIAKDNDVPVTLNLDALARWFEEWCKRNNLPLMSADELLAEIQAEALSVPDSVFDDLISFLHQWEYAEQYA